MSPKLLVEQIDKIPTEDSMFTFEKVAKRILKNYILDGETSKDKCEKCGGPMKFENGCAVCIDCGHSKCS